MSGYGGNLTYPNLKIFRNVLAGTGGPTGTDISGFIQARTVAANSAEAISIGMPAGLAAGKTLDLLEDGHTLYNTGGATLSYTRSQPGSPKSVDVMLSNLAPCDDCSYELGFTVVQRRRYPGVFNDNLYGFRRSYTHRFDRLMPLNGGYLADLDYMTALADIVSQITQDTGQGPTKQQGNSEAIVDATLEMTFSAALGAATFDIPAAGIFGQAWATPVTDANYATGTPLTVGNYLSGAATGAATATTVGATAVTNGGTQGAGITARPGYGFVVHVDGTQALDMTATKINLTTKNQWFTSLTDELSFNVEDVTGTFTAVAPGKWAVLPWKEVYRQFAHMSHDVPLSNHHYIEKPMSSVNFVKYVLTVTQKHFDILGASHGNDYRQTVEFYVPDDGGTGTFPDGGRIKTFHDLLTAFVA